MTGKRETERERQRVEGQQRKNGQGKGKQRRWGYCKEYREREGVEDCTTEEKVIDHIQIQLAYILIIIYS